MVSDELDDENESENLATQDDVALAPNETADSRAIIEKKIPKAVREMPL